MDGHRTNSGRVIENIRARVALTTHNSPRYSRLVELFARSRPSLSLALRGGSLFRRFAGQSGEVGSAAS